MWRMRIKMKKKITHKLSIEQKRQIWSLVKDGFSINDIAKKYEIDRKTVYTIGKQEKYKN